MLYSLWHYSNSSIWSLTSAHVSLSSAAKDYQQHLSLEGKKELYTWYINAQVTMHRINILGVRQITKLQEQWLELHSSVDYNALLFKKYNVNNFI